MDKSHVSMEQKVCAVCGKKYETDAILLDRRLKASMDRFTITGMGLCKEHQKLSDDGYIALVGCDPEKTNVSHGTVKMENAYRTGAICHIKDHAFLEIFKDVEIPESRFLFVDDAVIFKLNKM